MTDTPISLPKTASAGQPRLDNNDDEMDAASMGGEPAASVFTNVMGLREDRGYDGVSAKKAITDLGTGVVASRGGMTTQQDSLPDIPAFMSTKAPSGRRPAERGIAPTQSS